MGDPAAGDGPRPALDGSLQTVTRAMDVLLSFSDTRTDWGVYELAEQFGWTKSTSHRVLAALAGRGFLWADPYTRRYSLGPAVWRMSALWERTGGLARIADDPLRRLAKGTGLTSILAVPDGAFVRCVAAAPGPDGPMRARPLVGELYPAHAGATPRGYFAFTDPREQQMALYGLPLGRYNDATVVDAEKVKDLYEEAARAGYAVTYGEWDSRTWALAVPVRIGARVVGSLSLIGQRKNATDEKVADLVPMAQQVAEEIGNLLASRIHPPRRDWRRGKGGRAPRPAGQR